MYATPLHETRAALVPLTPHEQQALLCDPGLTHLATVFARVPDPRRRLGRRSSLPFSLTGLVAAALCNGHATLAVEEWCRAHQALIRQVIGPLRHLTPSGSLYRRLLPRLSVEHLRWNIWLGPWRGGGTRLGPLPTTKR